MSVSVSVCIIFLRPTEVSQAQLQLRELVTTKSLLRISLSDISKTNGSVLSCLCVSVSGCGISRHKHKVTDLLTKNVVNTKDNVTGVNIEIHIMYSFYAGL